MISHDPVDQEQQRRPPVGRCKRRTITCRRIETWLKRVSSTRANSRPRKGADDVAHVDGPVAPVGISAPVHRRPGILKGHRVCRVGLRPRSPTPVLLASGSSCMAIAARLFRASSTLRTKTVNAGQIADFIDWQQRVFGHQPAVFGRREKLWERLAQRLDPSRPLVVLEFGVAWGYATNWWLCRLGGRDVVWHGFDRFTGLRAPGANTSRARSSRW